jgi:signal transduction histidine kinase
MRGWMRSCVLASLMAACIPAVAAQAKTVVTIYGGEPRTPAYETFDRVFRQILVPSENLEFYEEYLDGARFSGAANERLLADYLRGRFAGKRVDAVIAVEASAVRFLKKYRDEIFPGVPVVAAALRGTTLAQLQLPSDFLGTAVPLDPAPTIGLALALRPGTNELVIVTGVADLDRAWESAFRATPLPSHVKLRVLSGMSLEAIERELAALGPNAVVVMSAFRRDGAGRTFPGSATVLDRLKAVSAAPIFNTNDSNVGRGSVGTFSPPLEAIAAQPAGIAKQLLRGTPVESVALPAPVAPVPTVDWRELRRWGIDERRLPPGSVIRFRVPTFWEQYRDHVIAVAVLIILETALVAGLLLQRRQRRRVEERLRESENTMQLAANAAQLVMWNWDIARDRIAMAEGHQHPGGAIPSGERDLDRFLGVIHEEDRDAVRRAIERALAGEGRYESEYRVVGDDGVTRWFAGRGSVEYVNGVATWLHGITLDVTRRKAAELDAQRQRNDLAHLSRVTVLGELSSSVAHELNQPLMAILSNAQAARMFINRDPVDLVEIGAILDDIVENDKRAGEIIWSMRKMLKKEEPVHEMLRVNDLVQDVLRLMRGDFANRGVTVAAGLATDVPAVWGDRMQLQQVLVNLIANACDAMSGLPKAERILGVRTERAGDSVRVSVADRGAGIPPESMAGIFTPFFTTKKHGLGLGLSVCTSIITSHGGELRAANNADRGATFAFELNAVAVEAIA